ncbi:hypothetical protein [Streptomyces albipurpureus]|uniref:Uncharacterized protein n=1 Tax=Streptomyces albipurpureus TaxID=2897419 RepID=A0ABT0UPL6_9ACTN|nr:hypothetical protein [Streptomyces sp. CWNU-1]MCM2390186.1 hypothetical protein [Streptomyces sp. CWNU-1]
MHERVQWMCELAGITAGAAGLVLIGGALAGVIGTGVALLVVAAVLITAGNVRGGA